MSRKSRYRGRELARIPTFTVTLAAVALGFDATAFATTVDRVGSQLRIGTAAGEQNTIVLSNVTNDIVEVAEQTAPFSILGFCAPSGTRAHCDTRLFTSVVADLGDGNDSLRANAVAIHDPLTANGVSGNDLIIGGALADTLDGGVGDDSLGGFAGKDVIHGDLGVPRVLAGADSLNGGADDDQLFARDGVPDTAINCGDGTADSADVDLRDQERDPRGRQRIGFCENITAGAVEEGPNVRIRGRSLKVSRRGRVTVRLSCPRAVSDGCAGELTLAGVRAAAAPGWPAAGTARSVPAGAARSGSVCRGVL